MLSILTTVKKTNKKTHMGQHPTKEDATVLVHYETNVDVTRKVVCY